MANVTHKIRKYQKLIIAILTEEVASFQKDNRQPRHYLITDKTNRYYQILYMGWLNPNRYVHNVVLNIHIAPDAKIWILANDTELLIGERLVALNVPKADIVLGFQPIEVRKYTEYAVS